MSSSELGFPVAEWLDAAARPSSGAAWRHIAGMLKKGIVDGWVTEISKPMDLSK